MPYGVIRTVPARAKPGERIAVRVDPQDPKAITVVPGPPGTDPEVGPPPQDLPAVDRSRWWAVVNQRRTALAEQYAASAPVLDSSPRSFRIFGWVALGAAALILVPAAVLGAVAVRGEGGALIPSIILGGVGLVTLHFTRLAFRSAHRTARNLLVYQGKQLQRDTYNAQLERLAVAWDGQVESAGAAPAQRFLLQHWPDPAPVDFLLRRYRSAEEIKQTVTGTLAGRPILLQVTDFWPPLPLVTPPQLGVFVAAPVVGRDPRSVAGGQRIVEAGLEVYANRAGVWAVHRGPADAILADDVALENIAKDLVSVCDDLPAGPPVPGAADPQRYDSTRWAVCKRFMYALMTRDGISVLAYLGPLAFKDARNPEPTPEEIDGIVNAANARPVRWYMTDFSSAYINDVAEHKYTLRIERASGAPAEATVYLDQYADTWAVCCYALQGKALVGKKPQSVD